MSDKTEPEVPNVYTVENLLTRLAFTAQNEVFKKIDALIRVQGRVGKVKNYPTASFFDLIGDEGSISVKAPSSFNIQMGEHLIFEGMPVIKTSRFHTGLAVELQAKPVAEWLPREQTSTPVELKKESFTLLDDYISTKGFGKLLIIGSETAIQDVLSNCNATFIETRVSNVSDKNKLLVSLKEAIRSGYEGLMIARGGNDQSLDIWDDPEFVQALNNLPAHIYLALGHSHRITLACQYADERFLTPTALGTAIHKILMRNQYMNELDQKCKNLESRNKDVEKQAHTYKQLQERSEKETNALHTKVEELSQKIATYRKPTLERIIIVTLSLACAYLFQY